MYVLVEEFHFSWIISTVPLTQILLNTLFSRNQNVCESGYRCILKINISSKKTVKPANKEMLYYHYTIAKSNINRLICILIFWKDYISRIVDEKQGKQKAAFAYSERYRLMLFFSVNSYRCLSAVLCCCLILGFFSSPQNAKARSKQGLKQ